MEKEIFSKNPLLVFDSIPMGIFTLDTQGFIHEVNQYLGSMIGFPKEALIGKKLSEVADIFKLDYRIMSKRFESILSGETQNPQSYSVTKSDGTTINILCRSIPIEKDNIIIGGIVFIEETTENIYLKKCFNESEKKYQNLVEQINEVICTIDSMGNIIYISPQISKYGFLQLII